MAPALSCFSGLKWAQALHTLSVSGTKRWFVGLLAFPLPGQSENEADDQEKPKGHRPGAEGVPGETRSPCFLHAAQK